MEGAIKKPGVYPIAGGLSLLQATAVAGGFEDTADQTVLLVRQQDGRRLGGRYDVAAIRKGNAEDPQLEAGDIIIAPTSDIKEGMGVVLKLLPLAMLGPML
jgi:polysaccharide export outer membrane protein